METHQTPELNHGPNGFDMKDVMVFFPQNALYQTDIADNHGTVCYVNHMNRRMPSFIVTPSWQNQ